MFGKKSTFIGLDVGSYSVKAVAIQPNKGRMTLVGYSQQRIGDQDVAVVIRQVVDQLGVKPSNLTSSVSGRSVIVRQVETPRITDRNMLKQHIEIEADKYIPFGIDEVQIDFQPLEDAEGEEGNANMNVQLVAVRRGFIEDHIGTLNNSGVHPKAIDVDLFALCNAYEVFGPVISDESPVTALVDIGASKVCVAIVKGSRPLFTREFYLAGNEITDAISRQFAENPDEIEELKANPGDSLQQLLDAAMPAIEDLANEIRLSFDYVESQHDENVQHIVLSGGSSQMASIADNLGNLLGKSITVFDGLAGLDLDPKRYDIQNLEANAPSLTVALGLAVHNAGEAIKGLGGHQLTGWNSGQGGGVVAASAAPAAEEAPAQDAGESSTTAPAPPPSEPIAPPPMSDAGLAVPGGAPPPAPEPFNMPGSEAPPAAPPPPAVDEPAAPLDFPPPAADNAAPPPPEAAAPAPVHEIPVAPPSGGEQVGDNLDAMFPKEGGQEAGDYGHQSSMLVILEDDENNAAPPPPPPPATDDGGLPPLDPP